MHALKPTNPEIYISKHALERYRERFGQQELKVIKSRLAAARLIETSKDGVETRVWGNIRFMIFSNTVTTIIKHK